MRAPVIAVERALSAIGRALPSDAVVTDRDVLASFADDESDQPAVLPDAVVRARDGEDVRRVLDAANAHGVPVTPRGTGTGKSGGCIPIEGGIVLAMQGLSRIVDIDRDELVAVVEPGVITGELHGAVEREGLFYAPDPNSLAECTLGGNIAENAGGPRTFKYGATRDWVLGLDVVSGAATPMTLGRRTRKGVTGYDLTALVTGSEGTLAVVTRAIVRLAPLPQRVVTLLAFLPDLPSIAHAVSALLRARMVPRCIEVLDDLTLDVMRGQSPVPIPAAARALLMVELDGDEAQLDAELSRAGDVLSALTPHELLVATGAGERERLWRVRREMSRALRRAAAHKLSEDVVVPRSALAPLLERCRLIADREGVRMPSYGHAGDGNLHVNFLWDDDARDRPRVDRAVRALFEAVIALGGTLSGEHGIGLAKAPFLALEQSEAVIDMQRRIKSTFDPRGVLNPGKIFASATHRAC